MNIRWIALAPAVLLVAACTAPMSTSTDQVEPLPATERGTAPGQDTSGAVAAAEKTDQQDRDVVRTGRITVVTTDLPAAQDSATQAIADAGGYVADLQVGTTIAPCMVEGVADGAPCPATGTDTDTTAAPGMLTMVLRVPTDSFDDVMGKLKELGEVTALAASAQDVTGQVADLDARIEAQRASVRRVRQLMDEAGSISELVTVESELAARQSELEAMEAQRKALQDSVAMATITATMVTPDRAAAVVPAESHWWDEPWQAFVTTWQAVLIAAAVVLPFLLIAAVAWWLIREFLRRRSERTAAQEPVPDDDEAEPAVVGGDDS